MSKRIPLEALTAEELAARKPLSTEVLETHADPFIRCALFDLEVWVMENEVLEMAERPMSNNQGGFMYARPGVIACGSVSAKHSSYVRTNAHYLGKTLYWKADEIAIWETIDTSRPSE